MFVGRENELAILKENYRSNGFKMVVIYGRRRVGKSYLLQHFFRNLDAKVVAFQAIADDVSLSIEAFRDALFEVYPPEYDINLDTWKKCFQYFVGQLGEDKAVICIDGKHRDGSTFDIDVFFRSEATAMCGECKFTNKEFSIADADELVENAKEIRYYVFSKSAVKDSVLQKYPFLTLVSLEDLFRE